MASIESRLWSLASEIEPTQAQKEDASRSHNFLRSVLRSGELASRITADYLSGSYSRDTAIRPIDDVDIIFILHPYGWGDPANPSSLLAPHLVLDAFASAIRARYPVSSVVGQRRSVRLQLYHLDIDVVPAAQDINNPDFIWIPDEKASGWIRSSPRRHSEVATNVNLSSGGRLKPLIKIIKFWNKGLPESVRFKSFAIETMAVLLFQNVALQSLEKGVLTFLDFISSFSGASRRYAWSNTYGVNLSPFGRAVIPDVAGTGTNVGVDIDFSRKTAFLRSAAEARDALLQAENLPSFDGSWNLIRRHFGMI